jgi:parallel beta-helix repeat protein
MTKKLLRVLLALVLATNPALAQMGYGPTPPAGYPASQTPGGVTTANLVCDGVTDNAATLTSLLTTAAAGNQTTVYFPPASNACMFASNVVVPAGITGLWANPGSVTLKAKTGNVSNPLLLSMSGVSNIRIFGLTLDGGGTGFASSNNVNTVFNSSNIVFDTVRLQNTKGIALIFSTAIVESGITNSVVTNVGGTAAQGVAFSSGAQYANHGNFVTLSTFDTTGLDAISIGTQYNFTAAGNKIDKAGSAAGAGIFVTGLNRGTIIGNTIRRSAGNGIDIASSQGVTVSGNSSETNGNSGIAVAYSNNMTIAGNTANNNNQSTGGSDGGLFLSGLSTPQTNVTISGNTFSDDQATVSTTCSGTVGVGATTCTLASATNVTVGETLTIAGAGVAAANLNVVVATISSASVITWNTATSTSTTNAVVTGNATQPYGIFQQAGGTNTNVFVDLNNILNGNTLGQFGGTISYYSNPAATTPLFGTGADGALSINSGVTTLTRDMNYTNLTISGTAVLKPSGFRIFVSGVLDISAAPAGAITTIQATGNAGSGVNGGTFTQPNIAPLTGITGSGVGGAGGAAGAVGNNGVSNTGAQPTVGNGGQTGAGGGGGTSGVHIGGTGAVQGKPAFNTGSIMVAFPTPNTGPFTQAVANAGQNFINNIWPSYSAGGGGGGGADASNAGGGGGASATEPYGIAIFANVIARGTNSTAGIITAAGSTGGAGANGVAGTAGGGGGAGGTGGAFIYIVAGSMTGSTITNALDVSGGTGGAGGNGLSTGTGGVGGNGGGCGGTQVVVLSPASFTQSTGWNTAGSAGNNPTGGGSNPTGGTGGAGAAKQVNL